MRFGQKLATCSVGSKVSFFLRELEFDLQEAFLQGTEALQMSSLAFFRRRYGRESHGSLQLPISCELVLARSPRLVFPH